MLLFYKKRYDEYRMVKEQDEQVKPYDAVIVLGPHTSQCHLKEVQERYPDRRCYVIDNIDGQRSTYDIKKELAALVQTGKVDKVSTQLYLYAHGRMGHDGSSYEHYTRLEKKTCKTKDFCHWLIEKGYHSIHNIACYSGAAKVNVGPESTYIAYSSPDTSSSSDVIRMVLEKHFNMMDQLADKGEVFLIDHALQILARNFFVPAVVRRNQYTEDGMDEVCYLPTYLTLPPYDPTRRQTQFEQSLECLMEQRYAILELPLEKVGVEEKKEMTEDYFSHAATVKQYKDIQILLPFMPDDTIASAIHNAIYNGNSGIIALIQKGLLAENRSLENINIIFNDKSYFHRRIEKSNDRAIDIFQKIQAMGISPLISSNYYGNQTALSLACELGRYNLVRAMLNTATDPASFINTRNADGTTPVQRACQKGQYKVAALCAEHGAVVEIAILKSVVDAIRKEGATETEALEPQKEFLVTCLYQMSCRGEKKQLANVKALFKGNNRLYTRLMGQRVHGEASAQEQLQKKPFNKSLNKLHLACLAGDLKSVHQLVESGNMTMYSARSRKGRTPFALACLGGHLDVADLLLKYHTPSAETLHSMILQAAEDGNDRVIVWLHDRQLLHKAFKHDPLLVDEMGVVLCQQGKQAQMVRLFDAVSRSDVSCDYTKTMQAALTEDHWGLVNDLLKHGAPLTNDLLKEATHHNQGGGILYRYYCESLQETTNDLMSKEDVIYRLIYWEQSHILEILLHNAIIDENSEWKEAILSQLEKPSGRALAHRVVDIARQKRRTVLHEACYLGDEKLVERLLALQADPSRLDGYGNNVLHYAIEKKNPILIELLLESPKMVLGQPDADRFPILQKMIYDPGISLELIEKAVVNGAPLDALDPDGNTILHAAYNSGRLDVLQLLLEYDDMPINQPNIKGETVFKRAYHDHNDALATELLKNDADPFAGVPIPMLSFEHNPKCDIALYHHLQNLTDGYASLNKHLEQYHGKTVLHLACELQNPKLIQMLINQGADITAQDAFGLMPQEYLMRSNPRFNEENRKKCIECFTERDDQLMVDHSAKQAIILHKTDVFEECLQQADWFTANHSLWQDKRYSDDLDVLIALQTPEQRACFKKSIDLLDNTKNFLLENYPLLEQAAQTLEKHQRYAPPNSNSLDLTSDPVFVGKNYEQSRC